MLVLEHFVLEQPLLDVLNVKINCNDYDDKNYVNEILSKGQKIVINAVS